MNDPTGDETRPDYYDCTQWDDWPKKNTRPGKHWKPVYRILPAYTGQPLDEVAADFAATAADITAPVYAKGRAYGWVPMSEKEKAAAERRAQAAAKARATRVKKDRQRDLAKLAALAKKHGITLPDPEEGP